MTAVRKFLFERSFDKVEEPEEVVEEETEEAPEPEEEAPSFSEEDMQAARDEAFAAGKEEGIREAAGTTESRVLEALTGLTDRFAELFQAQETANAATVETAVSVAVSIARKVFPALNERNALGEIERMAVMAMEKILEEPRVVIYVHPELAPALNERLETMAAQAGYKGKVEITPLDDIPVGDCRVEWSGGGAARDTAELWQEIDEIIERNLADDEADEAADHGGAGAGPAAPEAGVEKSAPGAPEAPAADGPERAEQAPSETAPGAGTEAEIEADAETEAKTDAGTEAEAEAGPETPDVEPSPEGAILDESAPADAPADTAEDQPQDASADEPPAATPPPEEAPDATDAPGDADTTTDREEP